MPEKACFARTVPETFFLSGMQQRGVTAAQDDELARQYPDITRIRETVGLFEMDIRDVEVPLKIRIVRTGDEYSGLANLAVREKGAKDYYRDTGSYPSKEAALNGTVAGFFRHLTTGASIREIKDAGK